MQFQGEAGDLGWREGRKMRNKTNSKCRRRMCARQERHWKKQWEPKSRTHLFAKPHSARFLACPYFGTGSGRRDVARNVDLGVDQPFDSPALPCLRHPLKALLVSARLSRPSCPVRKMSCLAMSRLADNANLCRIVIVNVLLMS